MNQRKSFFEALFDFSFSSFIATKVIGILYIISIVISSIVCLLLLLNLFNSGIGGVFSGLIGVPLLWIFNVIISRLSLESLIASIKTSENTARMSEIMQNQNP
jgi:Domain of unknown function (DUF4282)